MEMSFWREALLMVGAALAAAFGLARISLALHRGLVERFIGFIDAGALRQETSFRRLSASVDRLSANIGENTALVRRWAEHSRQEIGKS